MGDTSKTPENGRYYFQSWYARWTQHRMSEKSLREQLVGAWTLNSYVERDIETGVENYPFGEHPLGLILYTPDGYMSAQLQRPERLPFADG